MHEDGPDSSRRSLGLIGATLVGVGAIVGGGVLVLAGVAFGATGPSAVLAFLLNGTIAFLTALSFAEMSTAFPESGGPYLFAKRVLSVRSAFGVGWVLWFAYIVAGVLYALGFAEFTVALLVESFRLLGRAAPAWLDSRRAVVGTALGVTLGYTLSLIRKTGGGARWESAAKVLVFAILIGGGVVALRKSSARELAGDFSPFLANGAAGLFQAMGFTFITVQGFEVIATLAGEVREPRRTLPRAMLLSLGIALAIYLPLLVVITSAGTPAGRSISEMARAEPQTVMATAVRSFLGVPGYLLVMAAAILSTASALHANLFAASRVALSMARDRLLPRVLAEFSPVGRTPAVAVYASALTLVSILLMIPDLDAAGAAASLIFLIAFALAHWTSVLVRVRGGVAHDVYRTPLFPLVPLIGGAACGALALFQAVVVPAAGAITVLWLGLGGMLYYAVFSGRARAVDAMAEAHDPTLSRLRGRSPLVLVPIANPENAAALVGVASALSPPEIGRVLLLTVIERPSGSGPSNPPAALLSAERVLEQALTTAFSAGHAPEALVTIAPQPWPEIVRVARAHRCQSLLVGMSRIDEASGGELEQLLNEVECDVAVLRAPPGWSLEQARRLLVPVGGRGTHDELRARLIGSLCRTGQRDVTFLRVLDKAASKLQLEQAELELLRVAEEEAPGARRARALASDDPVRTMVELSLDSDLVVLGMQRQGGRALFGEVALRVAGRTAAATIMLSHRR